jgi:hypothetical protein
MFRATLAKWEIALSTTSATYCPRHPKEETAVSCASCGTPICTKCMVSTPVGMKCPACGLSRGGVLFTVSPGRFVLAGLTAMAAGAISTLAGGFGFFMFFLAFPYGYFAGTMVLKASGMKRGKKLEILTGCCVVLGALLVKLAPVFLVYASGGNVHEAFLPEEFMEPFLWVAVAIVTGCAVSKIRYI